jgi:hypothetical protein
MDYEDIQNRMNELQSFFDKLPNHENHTVMMWLKGLSKEDLFVLAYSGKGDIFGYMDGT